MAGETLLPNGWRRMSIGALEEEGIISDIQDGNHGEMHPKSVDYVPKGVPFVMASDLAGERLDLRGCAFISRELADSLRIGFARPNDVLLTHKATMGRVAIVPAGHDYIVLTPQVTYYRVGDAGRLSNRFLAYAFRGPEFQHQLNSDSDQSTRKYIGITAQRRLQIAVPPIKEQRAIANLLGSLDDKIELNRRKAETLDAMARALFQSWFVDFAPVRAKAEGGPASLPDDLAALPPDAISDDGVPRGWRSEPLRSQLTTSIVRGVSPSYSDDGLLVVNQKCIRNGRLDLSKARKHNDVLKPISVERVLQAGDVLINSTGVGTLGRVAQVRRIDHAMTADSHVTIVRLLTGQHYENVVGLSLLQAEAKIEELGEGSTGQTELSRGAVGGLATIVPPLEVRKAFDSIVNPLRDRADSAWREIDVLTELRDALLPRLISGELRIRDAKSKIEAA